MGGVLVPWQRKKLNERTDYVNPFDIRVFLINRRLHKGGFTHSSLCCIFPDVFCYLLNFLGLWHFFLMQHGL